MQHAGAGLQKIVTDTLRRAPTDDAAVLAWPLVCGTAVAGKTRALDFTDGVLSVQVPDANWRTQLLGLAPQYLAEVNKFVTKNVRKIAFVIAEDSTPQRAKAVTHT
ncbi:MAG TPA: DUF721 domain-containing protein [Terriglobales bacterium]|nr:DUF721 domain-containing protein [Terriglobales bacterium]